MRSERWFDMLLRESRDWCTEKKKSSKVTNCRWKLLKSLKFQSWSMEFQSVEFQLRKDKETLLNHAPITRWCGPEWMWLWNGSRKDVYLVSPRPDMYRYGPLGSPGPHYLQMTIHHMAMSTAPLT